MTRTEKAIRNEKIRAFVKEGHTRKEAADKYGVAVKTAEYICAGLGVCVEQSYRNQYTFGEYDTEDHVRKLISERTPDFEYVGNYTGADGSADIKCRTCGTITTRSMTCIRHRRIRCRTCEKRAIEKRQEQKAYERTEREVRKEFKRQTIRYREQRLCVCICCGNLFASTTERKYCSTECSKRYNNARSKDRRIRKIKERQKDVITIQRLYERDNGVCHLCQGVCDWNDYEIKDAVFIAGNDYPSIDHIIPVSRNGVHSWDNVKLAHRGCNSRRGISPLSEISAKAL